MAEKKGGVGKITEGKHGGSFYSPTVTDPEQVQYLSEQVWSVLQRPEDASLEMKTGL